MQWTPIEQFWPRKAAQLLSRINDAKKRGELRWWFESRLLQLIRAGVEPKEAERCSYEELKRIIKNSP